jgi:hypothetical protein
VLPIPLNEWPRGPRARQSYFLAVAVAVAVALAVAVAVAVALT